MEMKILLNENLYFFLRTFVYEIERLLHNIMTTLLFPITENGNVTTYQYKRGRTPSSVEDPFEEFKQKISKQEDDGGIDFGDDDEGIDFGDDAGGIDFGDDAGIDFGGEDEINYGDDIIDFDTVTTDSKIVCEVR